MTFPGETAEKYLQNKDRVIYLSHCTPDTDLGNAPLGISPAHFCVCGNLKKVENSHVIKRRKE